jgi:MYXO-CTERM domain-containing protein
VKRLALLTAALLWSAPLAAAPKELGFNVHQSPTVGLDAALAAGVGWVRVDFNWLDAEPSQAGVYNWAVFDAQVDAAVAKNLKVLAVLAYTPAWASEGDTKAGGSTNDVPKVGTYASFVTAAVNRYKAKISHYELWNEPNLEQFFEGTPQQYLDRILVPGADALHAACPACLVMGPGLATVGTEYATWMDAVLGGAASKIDIVSGHIYHAFPDGSGTGAGLTSDSFFNKLESHRVIKLGTATVYEGPLSFKESMNKHGVTKPFWLTETGREATLGNASEEGAQTKYYRRVLEEMLIRPWWTATIFYEGFDEPPAPYKWGAVVHDDSAPGGYVAKPVLGFLKKVTSSQPAFGGTKTDCDDGLDNDLDGTIDHPADLTCTALTSASEGVAPPPDAGGPVDVTPDAGEGPGGEDGGTGGPSGGQDLTGDDAADGDGGCRASSQGSAPPIALSLGAVFLLGALARRRRSKR